MTYDEVGASIVWPKILACRNCGCRVTVTGFQDMAKSLPGFGWLAGIPGGFQFACPNVCGAVYVAQCPAYRQLFHHASCVSYGGADVTAIGVGTMTPRRPKRRAVRRQPGGR